MTRLVAEAECKDVPPDFYSPSGSEYPVPCPSWGFCAGRALDTENRGAIPVAIPKGQFRDIVEVVEEVITHRDVLRQSIGLDLSSSIPAVNETALRLGLATVYGVPMMALSLRRTNEAPSGRQLGAQITFSLEIDVSLFLNGLKNRSDGYNITQITNLAQTLWEAQRNELASILGYIVDSEDIEIATIQSNSTRILQQLQIVSCPPGFWGADGRCVECTPGFFDNGTTISGCTPCP